MLILYVINWSSPIAAGDALKVAGAVSVSAALALYAWLEWR